MEAFVILAVLVAALLSFDLAALGRGVDSRDGSTDPRSPVRPTGIAA